MSEQTQHESSQPNHPSELDEIPVDELIRMTREFTRRITNEDRKRLGMDLRESGHQRSIQLSAPVTIQQFFSGEIDLDTHLARRYANAPLLSTIKLYPRSGQPAQRQATAIIASNDDSAVLSVDAHLDQAATLDFTFTMFSALGLRFRLSPLAAGERQRWLDLMRRPNGITFLWTHERWEQPHLIFVVREFFGRVYAFSPHGAEAAARLTPDTILDLLDWLEDLWFPGRRAEREAREAEAAQQPQEPAPGGDFIETPTHMRRPPRRRPHLRNAIPDAPEEQWADDMSPAAPDWTEPGVASEFAEQARLVEDAFPPAAVDDRGDDFSDNFSDEPGSDLDAGDLDSDLSADDLDW